MVLACARPDDVVLEIGAGDYRLARKLADKCQFVYGLELNPNLVRRARAELEIDNLAIIEGDAYSSWFPDDISMAVLLMRHCRQFGLLAAKLVESGCNRLVTNARWGMGVEEIDLTKPRVSYSEVDLGWTGCWCGAINFVEGPAQLLFAARESQVIEVYDCPNCANGRSEPTSDKDRGARIKPSRHLSTW